jgi:hypothetical protein
MSWKHWRYLVPAILVLVLFAIYWAPLFAAFVYEVIAFFSPLWLPVILLRLAWPLWLTYARSRYAASVTYRTIELVPGHETPRSPHPMELVFYSLYHRTEVSKHDFLMGKIRMPWSFEIYAHAGALRFFVHLPEEHREAVEARIRGEYSDIEMFETRDYSREIQFNPVTMQVAALEYALSKPDPYPLKTYASDEREKEKHDPFQELLEEIASVGKDEHVLLSYLVRPHQRDYVSYFEEPRDSLHKDAYRVIADIIGSHGDIQAASPQKQALVKAIESALQKPSFDCGIRALYIADKSAFKPEFAEKLPTLFSRFDDAELNGFTPYDPSERANFLAGELIELSPYARSLHLVHLFRRRAFFAPPYVGKQFILNTEELATIFHLPHAGHGARLAGRTVVALEPPENLPV